MVRFAETHGEHASFSYGVREANEHRLPENTATVLELGIRTRGQKGELQEMV